ncbi:hypothetical protein BDR03DRAFT_948723 [Suillus americanus]|nr:hypothetical protein BDR03DRAFT_948723 [Suillus americanus]
MAAAATRHQHYCIRDRLGQLIQVFTFGCESTCRESQTSSQVVTVWSPSTSDLLNL